jgi:hypothetical protein
MNSPTRIVALTLALALVLAACGSDSTESTTATPEPAPAATGATEAVEATEQATEQDIEADTVAAQAALLVVSDFPPGWTETPYVEDPANDERNRLLAECLGLDRPSIGDSPAKARTGDFASPEQDIEISQIIGLEAAEQDAVDIIESFADPDTPTCFAEVYSDTLAESADLGDGVELGGEITVAPVSVAPAGDDTAALRVTVPLTSDGFEVDVFADAVIVRVGRSLSFMFFASQGTPVDAGTIDEYAAVAASRMPT